MTAMRLPETRGAPRTQTPARPTVVVLDYGSGNVRSAVRALERAGARVELTVEPRAAESADGLVVPGVGAFASCAAGLRAVGGDQLIRARLAAQRPVLGICVGMQVLFTEGVEHGERAAGFDLWPGTVEALQARRLPHIGWSHVDAGTGTRLFRDVGRERFYFVHSYAVREWGEKPAVVSWSEHDGDRLVAGVEDGALWATQFHPEKTAAAGARVLHNWLEIL